MEIFLCPFTEQVARPDDQENPGDDADAVDQQIPAVFHLADPGHEGNEGPQHRRELRQDHRPDAILRIEGVGPLGMLALEEETFFAG